jgi:CHAT domain-containing protein/tetratricopeptide (TPR) repeat protein
MRFFRRVFSVSRKGVYSWVVSALLLFSFLCAPVAAAEDELILIAGRPTGGEITGGATRSLKVVVRAGDFLRVGIEQRSIDLAVTLLAPGGEKIVEADRYYKAPERVFLLAAEGGTYTLELRAKARSDLKGFYEVRIEESRSATPEDRERARAELLFDEATSLFRRGTVDLSRQAGLKYEEARAAFRRLDDKSGEAMSLAHAGAAYFFGDERRKGIEYQRQALAFSRAHTHRFAEAMSLRQLGLVLSRDGDRQGILNLQQALEIFRTLGELTAVSITLDLIGSHYQAQRDTQQAISYFKQALFIQQQLGDMTGQAAELSSIASAYNEQGEKQQALDFLNQAIPLVRATKNREVEAYILHIKFGVYNDLGEYQKALDSLEQALPLWREVGMRGNEASVIANMGVVYRALGDHRKALEHFKRALPIRRELGERAGEATILNHIGRALSDLGEHQAALDHLSRSLQLRRAVNDRGGEAATLNFIGATLLASGEAEKAAIHLAQALELARAAKAPKVEMRVLADLARAERTRGNITQALKWIEAALDMIESGRKNITSPQLRITHLASVQSYYELQIELLMELHRRDPSGGHDIRALQASERSRARGLLELLAEAGVDIRQGVARALLERESGLQQQIAAKSAEQVRLHTATASTTERKTAVDKELSELLDQHEQVQVKIRQASPRYAALTLPVAPALSDVQRLLDPDTVLLEYALGSEKSYVWAVTQDSLKSFELPRRAEIEQASRAVYELLTSRNVQPEGETAEGRLLRLAQADAELPARIEGLSRTILAPVAAQLAGRRRIVIIADGALQYIPFAALHAPSGTPQPDAALAANFEVAYLPSASTLALLRRRSDNRPRPTRAVAVVADPVFDEQDVRVRRARRDSSGLASTTDRGAADEAVRPGNSLRSGEDILRERVLRSLGGDGRGSASGRFPRLPFSRREAEMIFSVAPPSASAKILDFSASRETVMSREFGQYSIIHFATHGLLDSERPELSSIVLSLVDKEGRPVIGFLRLNEIYNLRLNAELAVLSACQTALGRDMRGEGMIGLTRGFMFAGARRVVASLWQVDDEATSELMKRFYEGMLRGKLSPTAALRSAQSEMARGAAGERFRSPYYWAGFVLQGEYK